MVNAPLRWQADHAEREASAARVAEALSRFPAEDPVETEARRERIREERAAALAARTEKPPSAPAPARSTPAAAVVARPAAVGVTRAQLDRRMAALEQAIARMAGFDRMAWQCRFGEAERRIAELETRLAAIEGTVR